MPSGVRIGEHEIVHGTPVAVEVVYEQRVETAAGAAEVEPAGIPDDVLVALASPIVAGDGNGDGNGHLAFAVRGSSEQVLES